ncbi:MAG: hypothetical protein HOY78_18695 [Saccharothrix sp.]|nr:hypothetical protein [Saccharothrix sp.]
MNAAAKAGRFGLPVVLLLLLLGLAVVPTWAAGGGHDVPPGAVVGSVSAPPTMHDDLDNRPGLSTAALRAASTAVHGHWWAVCSDARSGQAPRGRWTAGEAVGDGPVATAPASRCSRAPPGVNGTISV